MDKGSESKSKFWLDQANHAKRRFNLACWLSHWLPCVLVASGLAAVLLLWGRQNGFSTAVFWSGFAMVLIGSALYAYLNARENFMNLKEAMIRLETTHSLESGLSSALAGAGEYPDVVSEVSDGMQWNKTRIAASVLIAVSMPLAAHLIPVRIASSSIQLPKYRPLSLEQSQKLLDEMKESGVIDSEDLAQMQEQLDQLKQQEADEWYDQNSLEAADSFKEKLEQEAEEFLSKSENVKDSLSEMSSVDSNSLELRSERQGELAKSLQALENSGLGLDPSLKDSLSHLSEIDPSELSREQLEALKNQLKKGGKRLEKALKGGESTSEGSQEQSCGGGSGQSGGMCSQESGNGSGSSGGDQGGENADNNGIGRGGETAPLELKEKSPQITSNAQQKLDSKDPVPELGDFIGEERQAPKENSAVRGLRESGNNGNQSSGGLGAGRQRVTPEEAEVLKKYFK